MPFSTPALASQRDKPYGNHGNHKFDLTPEQLAREGQALTRKLRQAGLEPWGTLPIALIDHPDDALRLHVEEAARAEARCVRIGPPPCPDTPFDYAVLLDRVIKRYAHIIATLSRPMGIKLILETHCGSLIASPGLAWAVCRHFDPRDLGVIFDIANFTREGELRPNLAVAVLRDYIDCVHLGGGRRVTTTNSAAKSWPSNPARWKNPTCTRPRGSRPCRPPASGRPLSSRIFRPI